MRFEDERYVRLYTRDTVTWKLLPWQAKVLLPLLLRKVDRAGLLELEGEDAVEAIAAAVEIPVDVVGVGLAGLVTRKVIEVRGDTLVWPRFLEGQEAKTTDAQRKRDSREHARSKARLQGFDPGTDCHATGRPVTPCDQTSQAVTSGHSEPSLAEPSPLPAGEGSFSPSALLPPASPPPPTAQADLPLSPSAAPSAASTKAADAQRADLGSAKSAGVRRVVDGWRDEAERVLDALNAARSRAMGSARAIRPTYASLTGIAQCLDAGKTVEECLLVIAAYEAEIPNNPQGKRYFDAVSPWRPDNFERALASAPSAEDMAERDEARRRYAALEQRCIAAQESGEAFDE